jgi:hypothetical protein
MASGYVKLMRFHYGNCQEGSWNEFRHEYGVTGTYAGFCAESKEIYLPRKRRVANTTSDCRILEKSQCLKLYRLLIVRKLTAPDKLNSQFAAHVHTTLGMQQLLKSYFFTDEAKYHISEHGSWHNCIILGSEPLREHSEHESGSSKVNMWYALTHE